MAEVIGFYKCYNACVRAKVEGLLVGEGEVPPSKRRAARRAARRYFDLASRYAGDLPPAMLVIACGAGLENYIASLAAQCVPADS